MPEINYRIRYAQGESLQKYMNTPQKRLTFEQWARNQRVENRIPNIPNGATNYNPNAALNKAADPNRRPPPTNAPNPFKNIPFRDSPPPVNSPTPKPVPPPTPSAPVRAAPPSVPAAGVAAAAGAGGSIGLLPAVAGAAAGAVAFLLGHEPVADAVLPPEPPKEIEPPTYPFSGGQAATLYMVFFTRYFKDSQGKIITDTGIGDNITGPITGFAVKSGVFANQAYSIQISARNSPYPKISDGVYQVGFIPTGNQGGLTFLNAILNRVVRKDGQPDIGNPPPTQPPIFSTPGQTVASPSSPPEVGKNSPPQPITPQQIQPTNPIPARGGSSPAPTPQPQAPIPELQPEIPKLVSPLPYQETDPPIAQSPPPQTFPRVQVTPSTGVGASTPETNESPGLQVTPSTGVPPAAPTVDPVPGSGQKPNVNNPERVPTFPGQPQAQTIDRESITQQLLQIEQQLIQSRVAISSLTPQSTSQSISEQIQQAERRLGQLRTNINTLSTEAISQQLQQTEQELQKEERRLTNLEPDASADLQKNQLQQIRNRITQLRNGLIQPQTETEPQPPTQSQTQPDFERLRQQLTDLGLGIALLTPLVNPVNNIATNTTPEALRRAARQGTCETLQPGGCMTGIANNAQAAANNSNQNNNLLNQVLNILRGANETLLPFIWQRVQTIDNKLGAQMPGGLGGVLGRLSSSLGIDRVFNLINFLANLHNASMLSASLKVTLLEMLSSVGNATGLLQTSEGDNVDLNSVFNQGIEAFVVKMIGVDAWASMKLSWRRYSSIYRAATNSLNAVSSMFNSIGEVLETTAEHTGKIGNAIRAAGLVRENAYNFMAEKLNIKTSRFMTFQTKVGSVTQVLETVNEIAENIVEGQEQYTEAVKATTEFKKELADAQKNPGIDNKAIKEEAAKIKENLIKDPTGEDEEGLLSFLTDK